MDREEAKKILQVCRPDNSEDRADPVIAEAIALAEKDEELMAWFEAEQDFDRQMCDEFQTIAPPQDLKATILAGMRSHQSVARAAAEEAQKQEASEPIPFKTESSPSESATVEPTSSRSWWAQPWIGIAAAFIILFVVVAIPRGGQNATQVASTEVPAQAGAGVPDVLKFLSGQIDGMKMRGFDKAGRDPLQLKTYLANNGAPTPDQLPSLLLDSGSMGCVTFDYDGTKMSMICFEADDLYHLITINKNELPEQFSADPQMFQHDHNAFKVWEEGDKVMILSVEGTEQDIPEFI